MALRHRSLTEYEQLRTISAKEEQQQRHAAMDMRRGEQAMAGGWREVKDQASGKVIYMNSSTMERTTERPKSYKNLAGKVTKSGRHILLEDTLGGLSGGEGERGRGLTEDHTRTEVVIEGLGELVDETVDGVMKVSSGGNGNDKAAAGKGSEEKLPLAVVPHDMNKFTSVFPVTKPRVNSVENAVGFIVNKTKTTINGPNMPAPRSRSESEFEKKTRLIRKSTHEVKRRKSVVEHVKSFILRWGGATANSSEKDGGYVSFEQPLREQERVIATETLRRLHIRHMVMMADGMADGDAVRTRSEAHHICDPTHSRHTASSGSSGGEDGGDDGMRLAHHMSPLIRSTLSVDRPRAGEDRDEMETRLEGERLKLSLQKGHVLKRVYSFEDVAQGIVKLAMAQNAEDSVALKAGTLPDIRRALRALEAEVAHLQTTHHRQLQHRAHARLETTHRKMEKAEKVLQKQEKAEERQRHRAESRGKNRGPLAKSNSAEAGLISSPVTPSTQIRKFGGTKATPETVI
jgi:hypothetical protein